MQFNLNNYQFILTPIRLDSTQPLTGSYYLQLEKGCQRIHEINKEIEMKGEDQFYFGESQSICIKLFKERNMCLGWSLYKRQEGCLQFIDVLKFDLQPFYNTYINELKQYPLQYARLLQTKPNNSETAKSWISMKSHLKTIKRHSTISTNTCLFALGLIVQIKSDLDYIAQAQAQKNIIRRIQSRVSKVSEDAQINKENRSNPSTPSRKSEQALRQLLKQPIESGVMELPIMQKKVPFPALSDIIQLSHEQSHYHGDKTDRSDRKPSQLGLKSQINAPFSKAKTYHFVNDEQPQQGVRRMNSLQTFKQQLKFHPDVEDTVENKIEPLDQLTNESSLLKPESKLKQQTIVISVPKPALTLKSLMLILLFIILWGGISLVLCSNIKKKMQNKPLFESSKRIKKRKFKGFKL